MTEYSIFLDIIIDDAKVIDAKGIPLLTVCQCKLGAHDDQVPNINDTIYDFINISKRFYFGL